MKLFYFIATLLCLTTLRSEPISSISSKKILPHQSYQISPFIQDVINIEAVSDFFNERFYQLDPSYYEFNKSNVFGFSPEFMSDYLDQVYQLRRDKFIEPQNDKKVDAIICCLKKGAAIVRLQALKKSIQAGWKFNSIHIITRSNKEKNMCKELIKEIFPHDEIPSNINFTLTHVDSYLYERGCMLLKRHHQIAPHYLIIESSDLFSNKTEARCRRTLGLHSTCLGSNIFPIRNWRDEAIIHGYNKKFPKEEDLICQWFYSHMNFLARKIHHEYIHGFDLDDEELFTIQHLKKQKTFNPKDKSEIFHQLATIQYERSACEPAEEKSFIIPLIRSLGLIHYLKNLSSTNLVEGLIERINLLTHQKIPLMRSSHNIFLNREIYKKKLKELREHAAITISDPHCDIHQLLTQVNQQRDQILQNIITDSITVLGTPPCDFSILAFGSTGRNEATPYSDLEFGILYEHEDDTTRLYFQSLASTIMLKIVNLSETILYQLNFPYFRFNNKQNSKKQWFIDQVIQRGISIDIIDDPHSSKLPLATGEGLSFIGTPLKMALNLLLLPNEQYFGYSHLSERLIYGSEPLFQEYKKEKSNLPRDPFKKSADHFIQSIMQNYSETSIRDWDQKIDFKNTFYRPFAVLLEVISEKIGMERTSSIGRLEELHLLKLLDKKEFDELYHYFLLIMKMRLNLQLDRDGQYEGVLESDELTHLFYLKSKTQRLFEKIIKTLD